MGEGVDFSFGSKLQLTDLLSYEHDSVKVFLNPAFPVSNPTSCQCNIRWHGSCALSTAIVNFWYDAPE